MAIQTVSDLVSALSGASLLEEPQIQELSDSISTQFAEVTDVSKELVRRNWLTEFQVKLLAEGRGQNLVLGQYILLDLLGEGGMGQVFKARHRRLDRIDALKVIRSETLQSPDALRRFQREARAAARLQHPNIVTVYDADEANGTHYLAMEYVPGVDLASTVRKDGPLWVGQACEYIRQAAMGLQHAFERGMVHRDIKPANLLLTADRRQVKILDMGLARLATVEDRQQSVGDLTQSGIVMGTPDYMAPEQAIDSHAVDIRADIYSLGCTLYYLLSGKPTFPPSSLTQKLLWHQQREPEPLTNFRSDIPAEVDAVLKKMLAKRAENRFQTPQEVVNALQPLASLPATLERKPAVKTSGTKDVERGSSVNRKSQTDIVDGQATAMHLSSSNNLRSASDARSTASNIDGNTIDMPSYHPTPNPVAAPSPMFSPARNLDPATLNMKSKAAKAQPTEEPKLTPAAEPKTSDISPAKSNALFSMIVGVGGIAFVAACIYVAWMVMSPAPLSDAGSNKSGSGDAGAATSDRLRPVIIYDMKRQFLSSVALAPDGKQAVIGSLEDHLTVKALEGSQVANWNAAYEPGVGVSAIAWAPRSEVILTGSKSPKGGKTAMVWDVANKAHNPINEIDFDVESVALAPSGNLGLIGGSLGNQGRIALIDLGPRTAKRTIPNPADPVRKVVFSPSGKQFAFSTSSEIQVWDVAGEDKPVLAQAQRRNSRLELLSRWFSYSVRRRYEDLFLGP